MPRVTHVKKARKAIPAYGIKKGDSYYHWAFMVGGRGGPKICSKTPPKQSQLTRSEFWGAVYGLQESYAEQPDFDDLESTVDEIKGELNNIRDETQGKYDNLPDGLQQGESGSRLEERVNAMEEVISTLDGLDFSFDEEDVDVSGAKNDEEKQKIIEEAKQEKADDIWSEVTDALSDISCE